MNKEKTDKHELTLSFQGEGDAAKAVAATMVSPVPPPDGGVKAWMRVFGCFLVFFITWGVVSSFGSFQAFYQTDLLRQYSPSTISWIGTVQGSLLGTFGLITGPLFDRGYINWLLIAGSIMNIVGFFTLSVSKEYYQVLLSQGFCIGLGAGLFYVPSLAIVSTSFTTKRPIAIGVASTGSAIGGTVLPIMFRHLQPTIGFGWVCRIFGFIALGVSVLIIILMRPSASEMRRSSKPLVDPSAFKEPPYVLLCFGIFLTFLGYYIPLFFITPYAYLQLHLSADYSFYLLAILNAGSFAGRIIPALLAIVFGPGAVNAFGAISLGVLILAWTGITSVAGITVWAVLVGFMSGINVAMPSALYPLLSPSPTVIGARTGMAWSFGGVAGLIGAPIAGALVDTKTNNYRNGQIFGGVASLLGGLIMVYPALYIWRRDRRLKSAS